MGIDGTTPATREVAGPRVLVWCAVNALNTTVHHLYGAEIYHTPGRHHAVILAGALLAVITVGLELARFGDGGVARAGRWVYHLGALGGFVLAFGAFEGLYTHVIRPLLDGGYPPGEPFDPLFQATGVLHIVPAAVLAVILARLLRKHGKAA
ncbi:hypothetical protein Sru01_30420 [Sphaerisporangium rufum]|uniref:Uncharacterized protein n=1 Tax=Sphaerisporangium rufum TaxID=1381558 RepID=A0A919V588_9ACTN|nr:hypothetical protein [Sphaerisporangium rufum]GII78060.1 hypothetical protein Sru01_30420 [Sphaerisporangium rufum]